MRKNGNSCGNGLNKMVLPCSGASNVGQITNEVAKNMDVNGIAKFFCLAGVGGHISGMLASVKTSDNILVLDGCPVACGKKCMQEAGFENFEHFVVSEMGITKKHEFDIQSHDIERVYNACCGTTNENKQCACSGGNA